MIARENDQTNAPLKMGDPSDRELRSAKGKRPYPRPAKVKVAGKPQDDTQDPAEADPKAPHDRGVAKGDNYERGIESARRKVGEDDEAWRKGRTQN